MATYTLVTKVLKSQATAAGDEVYQGGELHDAQGQSPRQIGTFGMILDTITGVTNVQNLDTSLVTLQLFFFSNQQGPHGHGGGGGGHNRGQAPETMVLMGANEFEGAPNQAQPKQTDRAIGSVAAASPQFASHIGKQFTLQGNKLTIV